MMLFCFVLILISAGITESCKKNSDCGGGFCDGGTFWKSGTCRPLVADGGNCLQSGDSNSCVGGKCICGICGQKVSGGKRCSKNSDCQSEWCNGFPTAFCRGTCGPKVADNQRCRGLADSNSCRSGHCTCGYCGRKLSEGLPCSRNDDCQSGWCDGIFTTIICRGTCKEKTRDYGACPLNNLGSGDNNNCKSGRCEKVSPIKALCSPRNGFRVGTACNEDVDCDKTKSLFCNGGSFYQSGKCAQCPSNCSNGCNALFNQMGRMKCGRMTTFDHAADSARKISKPIFDFVDCLLPQVGGCIKDASKGLSSCLDPDKPCKIKFGGKRSTCLALTNPGLSFSYSDDPVNLSGSVKPVGGVSVEADITNGKVNLALYGRLAVKAEAVFETKASKTLSYTRKLYLSDCDGKKCSPCRSPTSDVECKPLVLFAKAFAAGYIPIILELKIRAIAQLSVDMKTKGPFKAGLSYENDAVISIKKAVATFDPINGVNLDVGFDSSFNKTIQKTLIVPAGGNLRGVVRIGAEITVAVNGIPITIFPSVRLVAEGNAEINSTGCLIGSFAAGIGIDSGISIGLMLPNPGRLMGAACRGLVDATCNLPGANILNCAAKEIVNKDPCKEAKGLCGKLEVEIAKVTPGNLGVNYTGARTIIPPTFSPFNPSGIGYCSGGQKLFLSTAGNVMQGKLHGGGGGRLIETFGAPGVGGKQTSGSTGTINSSCAFVTALSALIFIAL